MNKNQEIYEYLKANFNLSKKQLAEVLNTSQQACGQGLSKEKLYLTNDKLLKVYDYVKYINSTQAEIFKTKYDIIILEEDYQYKFLKNNIFLDLRKIIDQQKVKIVSSKISFEETVELLSLLESINNTLQNFNKD